MDSVSFLTECSLLNMTLTTEDWVGKDPSVDGYVGAERLGVFYPRGATLGGSAVINAAATFLPSNSDWNIFDKETGVSLWRSVAK